VLGILHRADLGTVGLEHQVKAATHAQRGPGRIAEDRLQADQIARGVMPQPGVVAARHHSLCIQLA
jgi:hypothetical protein